MATRTVQVSLPGDLLREVDARSETKHLGRSAVVQRALRLYLQHARRQQTDRAYERAYGKRGDAVSEDFDDLMDGQERMREVCIALDIAMGCRS